MFHLQVGDRRPQGREKHAEPSVHRHRAEQAAPNPPALCHLPSLDVAPLDRVDEPILEVRREQRIDRGIGHLHSPHCGQGGAQYVHAEVRRGGRLRRHEHRTETERDQQVADVEAKKEAIEERLQLLPSGSSLEAPNIDTSGHCTVVVSSWKVTTESIEFRISELALNTSSTKANSTSGSLPAVTRTKWS